MKPGVFRGMSVVAVFVVILLGASMITAQEGPLGNLPSPLANDSAPTILEGQWDSPCFPLNIGNEQDNGADLSFSFVGNRWQVIFTLFTNPDCDAPMVSFRREGPFAFGQPSATIDGATEMIFVGTKVTATAYDEGSAEFLSSIDCGTESFVLSEEQDVSDTGCFIFLPVEVRAIEYDLIYFDENGFLHLGLRPANDDLSLPEYRPVEINPLPLAFVG
jgi:hypothetical protein